MFLELARDYDTLARDDSDKGQGLMGKRKSDGKKLTRTEWEDSIEWLEKHNYIEDRGSGYQWKQGASAQLALESITHPPTR